MTAISESLAEADAAIRAAEVAIKASSGAVDYHAILNAWRAETLNGSPVARNTDGYNYMVETAIPDLMKRLSA
jgi:hypothetical protein